MDAVAPSFSSSADANRLPLCVSIGDPAGIGPDVVLSAWAMAQAGDIHLPRFHILGDVELLRERAVLLGLNVSIRDASDAQTTPHALPVIPLINKLKSQAGKALPEDATGVIEAIDRSVTMIADGLASGFVTLPINKKHLYDAGFQFPGHTEYLAHLATQWADTPDDVQSVMMLAGPDLKAVPVTIHIPLEQVKTTLTTALIIETARIVARDLQSRFGVVAPRLAFAGLNPHAGEDGALGREEKDIIEPALAQLRKDGIDCIGPLPADTMFHARARKAYDVALCMYHDQALIPAKALAFDDSVNVTLGLPFIRTSPDHGTAYDIAGTGQANPSSFIAALQMAADMADQKTATNA